MIRIVLTCNRFESGFGMIQMRKIKSNINRIRIYRIKSLYGTITKPKLLLTAKLGFMRMQNYSKQQRGQWRGENRGGRSLSL
ncbi:hypothetical protein HanRHA438_Chr08g0339071 [Helianthus annuus]|nr:hypothetical protein HanRHA438_Chr08g0339071 [Helianthus annuus]